jgi:tRNA A37 threonylcarbamoyladenosine biosynthesis protein TsaE
MGNTQAKTKGKTASAGIKLMHSSNEQSNVLLFGLEGAGKTHMLYRRLAGNTLDHSYEN